MYSVIIPARTFQVLLRRNKCSLTTCGIINCGRGVISTEGMLCKLAGAPAVHCGCVDFGQGLISAYIGIDCSQQLDMCTVYSPWVFWRKHVVSESYKVINKVRKKVRKQFILIAKQVFVKNEYIRPLLNNSNRIIVNNKNQIHVAQDDVRVAAWCRELSNSWIDDVVGLSSRFLPRWLRCRWLVAPLYRTRILDRLELESTQRETQVGIVNNSPTWQKSGQMIWIIMVRDPAQSEDDTTKWS
jgi:hypothetical protein